ncbi:alpha-hydroxy-acid oxidizing protein [Alphaproteobacteria bacterium KMM 3653]|uniref:Alpha-hydroxy-acid oxidizing protein n=1 Tax=Harenicola maris TaxID=2841044 RepID=A0AAP2CKE3_9RHOB|nr:alpha-hydroxy-acid oxidizing protein [Harenicola maris]
MDADLKYPAISDLRARARRRIPGFAFEYLDSATGTEAGMARNRAALDAVGFMPEILRGKITADISCTFMGQAFPLPLGIAPVGMAGTIWPGAERLLAQAARRIGIPCGLSTVAAATPEEIGPHAGDMGWFQLYTPADREICRDMLRRARAAGYKKLIVTVDVPGESRRERQRRAHLSMPPKLTPRMVAAMATHPRWSLAMAREGAPRMKFAESYVPKTVKGARAFAHAGKIIRGYPDWDYIAFIRQVWKGDLLIKGVQNPADATRLRDMGADAIWVSNHSGRQFEGGPAAITALPAIRSALGPDTPLIFDSGIAGGLDIMRAIALGADFVMSGRAFHYALAAMGPPGVDHLIHMLTDDMQSNMAQIGAKSLADLPERLLPQSL